MKKTIVALMIVMVLVLSSVVVANAVSFSGSTISETAWKTFVSGATSSFPTFSVYVKTASKPVVGQCFKASDNYSWASALYTYPKNGNGGYSAKNYDYISDGDKVNWRMRTNNDTTGSASVSGYFLP